MHDARDAHGADETGEESERPEYAAEAGTKQTKRKSQRKRGGGVEHDKRSARAVESSTGLKAVNGCDVIGVGAMDELAASGPVRKEIAIGNCERESQDKCGEDDEREEIARREPLPEARTHLCFLPFKDWHAGNGGKSQKATSLILFENEPSKENEQRDFNT